MTSKVGGCKYWLGDQSKIEASDWTIHITEFELTNHNATFADWNPSLDNLIILNKVQNNKPFDNCSHLTNKSIHTILYIYVTVKDILINQHSSKKLFLFIFCRDNYFSA